MTPKQKCIYAIFLIILLIVLLFAFEGLIPTVILDVLPLIIMYMIMYKVSDYIDIRYANFIVIIIPFIYLIMIKLLG